METQMIQETGWKSNRTSATVYCTHQRLIDDVRTSSGKRTGQVRCVECRAIFDDPYEGLK